MKKYIAFLKQSPLFSSMTEEEILSILHCVEARLVTTEDNEYIFRAGQSTAEMGMVLTGSVLIVQEDLWGHRNIMSKCLPGDFFGEPFAATPGTILNISVVSSAPTTLLMLNIQKLLHSCPNTCAHHAALIRNLVSVLADKILIFNNKITHMSRRTTREKILSYLSAESLRRGTLSFDIPYDRQQLADYLCVERAAMSVELSKLQKEGYFTTKKNHFILSPKNEYFSFD